MPSNKPEFGLDEELLALTGGIEVKNIPDTDLEKLNKVMDLYLRRWGKEFDANVSPGQMQKKATAQRAFADFIFDRMNQREARYTLRLEIIESEDTGKQKKLNDFRAAKKNEDGLFVVEVQSVDKYFSSVRKRPFALLPEAKPVMEVDEDNNGMALILNPNDIYSLSFENPTK